jgi:AP-3 complex subunit delta-1
MIGYNVSWAAFAVVEVMSFSRFAHKRIGYLAANQTFNDSTDLILLTTNLYKKELLSSNMGSSQYEVGLALNSLSNIVTSELGRDCLSDIIRLVNHSIPYLRKRAVLTLYKLYIKYPAGLRLTFDLIKDRLDDSDSSVVSTAVSVICELANRNPANYLALAPKFFKLLTTSSNNWLLIKLVKLFGLLVSEEPRLARKLIDPLVTLILNNAAKSLQFECINTLTTAYLYTKKEDGTDAKNVPNAVKVCSDHLRIFITDTDQNLKVLNNVYSSALLMLMRLYLVPGPCGTRQSHEKPSSSCSRASRYSPTMSTRCRCHYTY